MGRKKKTGGRGGFRPGAGRKRKAPRKRVDHRERLRFSELSLFHVTLRIQPGLPTLRTPEAVNVIARIFAKAVREGRLAPVVWSVQHNHIHMLIEADSTAQLSRGMQSLNVRIAKGLNRLWRRRGSLFDDRYHARLVEGVRDTRNALRYVLLNHKNHGCKKSEIDWASSGPWFEGWAGRFGVVAPGPRPVAPARSMMLREGWRMGMTLLDVTDQPLGKRWFRDVPAN